MDEHTKTVNRPAWLLAAIDLCDSMHRQQEVERSLSLRGSLTWVPGAPCRGCSESGLFHCMELDTGALYECAEMWYCPRCGAATVVSESANFAPHQQQRFLPILKQKLNSDRRHRESCRLASQPCPICRDACYVFTKDLGGVDYYENYWTVCVNPRCPWPGEHREHIESVC